MTVIVKFNPRIKVVRVLVSPDPGRAGRVVERVTKAMLARAARGETVVIHHYVGLGRHPLPGPLLQNLKLSKIDSIVVDLAFSNNLCYY